MKMYNLKESIASILGFIIGIVILSVGLYKTFPSDYIFIYMYISFFLYVCTLILLPNSFFNKYYNFNTSFLKLFFISLLLPLFLRNEI